MTTHPLATYLIDCRSRHGTGATTAETSLYPPLEALLNAAGQGLKPRVRCFMSLKNQGAGLPDGGLFTPDQIARGADEPPPGQAPARGVIECKKPRDDVLAVARTEQVSERVGLHLGWLPTTTASERRPWSSSRPSAAPATMASRLSRSYCPRRTDARGARTAPGGKSGRHAKKCS